MLCRGTRSKGLGLEFLPTTIHQILQKNEKKSIVEYILYFNSVNG